MPDENTRADSLRVYLTGAASHAGAQTDPDASLGNHQSSTEVEGLSALVGSGLTGDISIDYVGGANGEGVGEIEATGADALAWTAPGGTQGAPVTITNGQTKILEDADDPAAYIRVTRNSATGLSGSASVTLSIPRNNAVGLDDITSAEAAAGDDEYRCVCVENTGSGSIGNLKVFIGQLGTEAVTDSAQLSGSGAGTITTSVNSFSDWPQSGWAAIYTSGGTLREIVYYESRTSASLTVPAGGRSRLGTSAAAGAATDVAKAVPGIRIGLDEPASQPSGAFVDNTGSGEGTAPAGVTFETPYSEAEALSIGTLAATNIWGIWIHRETPAGMEGLANLLHHLDFRYDAA